MTEVVDRLESFYILQPGSSHIRWDCRGEDACKKGGGLLKTFLQRLHRGEGLSQDQLNKAASESCICMPEQLLAFRTQHHPPAIQLQLSITQI